VRRREVYADGQFSAKAERVKLPFGKSSHPD
jgi:hypothetical protein